MYLIHIHTVSPIIISYTTLYYIIIILVLYTTSLPVSMLAHTTFMTVTIAFVPLSFCMHACILVDASCNNQSSVSVSHSKCLSSTQPVTLVTLTWPKSNQQQSDNLRCTYRLCSSRQDTALLAHGPPGLVRPGGSPVYHPQHH